MKTRSIFLFAISLTAACASIHVVTEAKTGGVIALEGSRESAMGKAREEMARVCGGEKNYEVTEEGEVGYGGATVPPGTDPHEWRVHYACNSGGNSPGIPTASSSATIADASAD